MTKPKVKVDTKVSPHIQLSGAILQLEDISRRLDDLQSKLMGENALPTEGNDILEPSIYTVLNEGPGWIDSTRKSIMEKIDNIDSTIF